MALEAIQMQGIFPIMKRRDDQITLRVPGTLRVALEAEAVRRGRGISHVIRNILIDVLTQRITDRAARLSEHTGETA
jgi:hypothetical protein